MLPIIIYYRAEIEILLGINKYKGGVSEMLEHLRAIREDFKKSYPQYKNITEAYESMNNY